MKRPKGCSNSNLDKLWASRVKDEADWVCEICGKPATAAHHIHHRHNHSVRWWIPNGAALCDECHTNGPYSAHKNPAGFMREIRILRGQEWENELIERTAKIFKWQKHLESIKKYLKGEISDYLSED